MKKVGKTPGNRDVWLMNKILMQQVEAERNGKKSIRNGQDPWNPEIRETNG